jgi:hypothetical protein
MKIMEISGKFLVVFLNSVNSFAATRQWSHPGTKKQSVFLPLSIDEK